MNRRKFLINTTLISTLPFNKLYSERKKLNMNQVKYKLKIGEFDCTIFRDLMFKYKANDYFINADQEELKRSLKHYKIDPENIPSPFIAVLLEGKGRKVLIDTGSGYSEEPIVFRGNKFPLKGQLVQLLEEEEIDRALITDVIITHFHPDHIGGIISQEEGLNFPNAKFHIQSEEWEYWHSSKSDNQIPLFKFFVEKNITPLSKRDLNLIKGDFKEILPGIKTIKLEGHTPGQIGLIINQGQGENQLMYISDAFLHPLHIEQLDWQTNYDLDHKKARQSRNKVLELAYEENMLINGFHFDFPGLGRVEKLKNKWNWNYSTE